MTSLQAALRRVLGGKPCVVIGSANVPVFGVANDELMVAVNGGISNCPDWPIRVWVLNARTNADARNHPLYPLMVSQGARRHVGLLVLFTWGDDELAVTQTLARLKAQGTTWDAVIDINNPTRRRIETLAGGRAPDMTKHALSAGLSAACLCLWADAASVRLEGFSWAPGYAYPTPRRVTNRGHDVGDKWALARLARSHGDRLHHALTIPVAFHATAHKEVFMRRKPRTTPEESAAAAAAWTGPRTVRATKDVFYGGMRRREGDVFTLRSPSHFKTSCMADVEPGAKSERPSAAVQQERAKEIAKAMAGRLVAPTAADPVDEPVGIGVSKDVL